MKYNIVGIMSISALAKDLIIIAPIKGIEPMIMLIKLESSGI